MSDDNLILRDIVRKLAERDATVTIRDLPSFTWIKPSDALLRQWPQITDPSSGMNARPIGVAISHEEALPITPLLGGRPIVGNAALIEQGDTVTAAATVELPNVPKPHVLRPRSVRSTNSFGTPTIKPQPKSRIVRAPGHWMERVAYGFFFFSPKTFKRFGEENIADYRNEMVEAEARGDSPLALHLLRAQHWGGFFFCVLGKLVDGVLGRIVKAFRGG